MEHAMVINTDNFTPEVLEASYQHPVLLDFFATWCGPCQMIKPILEKLAVEYGIILAKVDIDQNPELANRYHVEGVPDIRMVHQGDVIPGFVGALPEPQIREMLSKFNLQSSLEQDLESIRGLIAQKQYPQVKSVLDRLFETYPQDPRVVLVAAEFLTHLGQLEEAEKMLMTVGKENIELFSKAQSMKGLLYFQRQVSLSVETELDREYVDTCRRVLDLDYQGALEGLLYFVEQHRSYEQDAGRKGMLALFEYLGNTHPLTQEYRKKLVSSLY
ncbi:MAG: tetratricopeptide repeat protein [Roseofilum sp. SBFL]|uniref:tetratricopeptide repeat protein n=1 Tax=unclassified Roseofilum TaxID=2620099 RepID=UPI001B066780|nr:MULTISPECIES: tetratricopeptide repeat protein [unclassified Roseofilum]MBP0013122.1 tetratricopeptide repeat protein [Roseofilum sp. SID3]MBP0023710.1 tetratricopeptide repeat protein [Roseofilum sp. SID2]MBP0036783.1 tetratricopeptide repeat protein [Roseofilum sp. SID1]MBP0042572.1 tetratricopeptide repeat protein [Roseofilum sp. SBFL]